MGHKNGAPAARGSPQNIGVQRVAHHGLVGQRERYRRPGRLPALELYRHPPPVDLDDLRAAWSARWDDAVSAWSRFTKLSEPRWCMTRDDEEREGELGDEAFDIEDLDLEDLDLDTEEEDDDGEDA